MTLLIRRRVCRHTTAGILVSFLAIALWVFHTFGQDLSSIPVQSSNVADMAQQIRINSLRLTVLESRAAHLEAAHSAILWLLVMNLAAGVASLTTYVITHQRKRATDY